AIEHLVDLGRRRIAFLVGDVTASHYAERLSAYREMIAARGLAADPELVQTDIVSYAEGQAAAETLSRLPTPPNALLCATDTIAIAPRWGAGASGGGRRDVGAVIGSGHAELRPSPTPPLTTVGQQKYLVGATAVEIMLRRLGERQGTASPPVTRV